MSITEGMDLDVVMIEVVILGLWLSLSLLDEDDLDEQGL